MAYADRTNEHVDRAPGSRPERRGEPAGGPSAPDARQRPTNAAGAGMPGQVRPAHPLPAQRSGTLDYDRYLERSTSKFKIFSAAEQRRRRRTIAIGAAIGALAVIIVVWAIMSQTPTA